MGEFYQDFRVPVSFKGSGYVIARGYVEAPDDQEEPNREQMAAMKSDAERLVNNTSWNDLSNVVDADIEGGVKFDWSEADAVED